MDIMAAHAASCSGLFIATTIAGVCTVILILLWLWRPSAFYRPCGSAQMPPGPAGLPIIGYLNNLGALPHQTLARLSNIHGPLMCVRLGRVPVVVVSSAAMAKHILHTNDKCFAGRPQHLSASHIINGSPNILFSQPGPYWKLMRQLFTTDLFSTKRIHHFRSHRVLEVGVLLRCVLAAQGSPLCLREPLHTFSSNTISRMALGKPLQELISADPNSLNILSILSEILSLIGAFDLGDYIPFLAWMDVHGIGRRCRVVARKVSSVFQTIIDRRRRDELATDQPRDCDFLDLLLLASADAKYKHLQLEDGHVRAMLLEMFVAGTDTSAITVEWALAELLANPEKLKHVQQELDEKVGTLRIVQEADIPNLPYLRAVVNETMRLHPAGALLVPHMSLEECKVEGYHIPANTDVYINAWAIHRDPSVWESPLEFHPERFLGCTLQDAVPGQHFEFLPFGSGRRVCLGWKLGLLNVQNVLANLLHAFDWSTLAGKPPSLNEKFGLAVALEHPLTAIPMPRLSRPLYDIVL